MRLVPFEISHFSLLRGWFPDAVALAAWGGTGLAHPLSEDDLAAMLAAGNVTPPRRLCFMAADRSGAILGHVQLALDWRDGIARLSRVAVAPGLRGGGIGRRMVTLAADRAFAMPQMMRVELNVYGWNAPARRAYAAAGFREEGIRRSAAQVGAARWDVVIMARLRDEWSGAGASA